MANMEKVKDDLIIINLYDTTKLQRINEICLLSYSLELNFLPLAQWVYMISEEASLFLVNMHTFD